MAFILFYNWSILLLLVLPMLLCFAVLLLYRTCLPSLLLLCTDEIVVAVFPSLLRHHPYFCRRQRHQYYVPVYVVYKLLMSLSPSLLLSLLLLRLSLLLLLLYSIVVSIRLNSFSFRGSFAHRCIKIKE